MTDGDLREIARIFVARCGVALEGTGASANSSKIACRACLTAASALFWETDIESENTSAPCRPCPVSTQIVQSGTPRTAISEIKKWRPMFRGRRNTSSLIRSSEPGWMMTLFSRLPAPRATDFILKNAALFGESSAMVAAPLRSKGAFNSCDYCSRILRSACRAPRTLEARRVLGTIR